MATRTIGSELLLPLPLRERAQERIHEQVWVRGSLRKKILTKKTPHPFEFVAKPELPSPSRGEGASTGAQCVAIKGGQ